MEAKKNYFQKRLLEWASSNLRHYTWRVDRTPYKVFISEFFLQRTKADQVQNVFSEFISRYPNTEKLKTITEEELTYFFGKLGLLKRKEYMQKNIDTLRILNKNFEDLTEDEIAGFLGVGRYTHSAIMCFGFNKRTALIDSNIIRIFERFFPIKSDLKTAKYDRALWKFADELVPDENYAKYNYAIIDLGGLICLPKNPDCMSCYLKDMCDYYRKINRNIYEKNSFNQDKK